MSISNKLLSFHGYCIPKPIHIENKRLGKVSPSFGYAGEDSFFTFKVDKQLQTAEHAHVSSPLFFIGVADGVGSWKPKKAKDAAKYSQQLMLNAIKYLSNATLDDISGEGINLSHEVARYSAQHVNGLQGASTLTIVNIEEYNHDNYKCQLNAYNIGDSGFNVYRHKKQNTKPTNDDCYEIIYKSPAQEQGFGVPFQLGSHSTSNTIDDGYCLDHFNLCALDIIVVGSDGLWDNLWDHEIQAIVCQTMTMYYNKSAQIKDSDYNTYVHNQVMSGDLTHKIMKQAYMNSVDRTRSTPWSVTMQDTVDMVYNGGKHDDITCVVLFVHM